MLERTWRKGSPVHFFGNVNQFSSMENIMKFSQKTKNRTTILSSCFTPGYISGKNENTNSKRYLHANVHSSNIYNSEDMEATQVPINRRMDKDVMYIYTMEYYSAIKRMK